ncbi:MAG: tRNA (adenosine(37)-N6)-threonylcarbamoyltransferase complex transferase subunit TsaD, partial [Bacteroidota bacterium]|nr:tRNA (adenosine(37)-N6)-threonylcarbamoyltransferase complex transferase subunit TsaD [Bacteroidota bacterium]
VAPEDIDLVSATQGPGLIGSLVVGLNFAKAFAAARDIPFLPVHHVEAHMFSVFLERPYPAYPFLSLVVSGGHTLLAAVESHDRYAILGSTIDDAAGEAFDKVAKMLKLGFPGGPEIEKRARSGRNQAIPFPRPMIDSPDDNFSFSGLKTSVLYYLRRYYRPFLDGEQALPAEDLADICASFQAAVIDVLCGKTLRAAQRTGIRDIALSGGVSANGTLRSRMGSMADTHGLRVYLPSREFTTDNAAMVANRARLLAERIDLRTLIAPAFSRIVGLRRHERS